MARLLSLVSRLTLSLARGIDHRIDIAAKTVASHLSRSSDDPRDYLGFALVPAGAPAVRQNEPHTDSLSEQTTKQLLDDIFGTLFAVPKKYRTKSVRQVKRQGQLKWAPHGSKLLVPKIDIVACQTCGHYHEVRFLCEHCYAKVKAASKVIQEAMAKEFEEQPVDREIVVRYKGETTTYSETEADEKVRIVEIDDERPEWFSQNLLSKPHRTALPAEPSVSQEANK